MSRPVQGLFERSSRAVTPNPRVSALLDLAAQRAAAEGLAASGLGELLRGYYVCNVLQAMAETGLADRLLSSSRALGEAELLAGVDLELGRGALRFLVIQQLLESDNGAYALTERGRLLLSEIPRHLIGYHLASYGPVLRAMPGLLRGELQYGEHVSRDTRALGEHCEPLARAFVTPLLLESLLEGQVRKVLDLGCGNGAFLIDACGALPELGGVGLDIAADVIELANDKVRAAGLEKRIEMVCGDAFQPAQWPKSCDDCEAWVMVGALHEQFRKGEAAVVQILDEYAARMRAGSGRLFILVEPEIHYDQRDANFFLCHALTKQGYPRAQAGWYQVLERSAFQLLRVRQSPGLPFSFVQYELGLRS